MSDRWRVGRKVGRTIYIQVGDEPSSRDELIGVMDSLGLAQTAVDAVNASTAMQFGADDLEITFYADRDNPVDEGPRSVTIRHLPSGISTSCHSQRSQLMNKVKCLEEIRAALLAGVPGDPS